MRYLVDTHVLIWYAGDDDRLSRRVSGIIDAAVGDVFVSDASLWQIAIKLSLGKLKLARPLNQFISDVQASGKFLGLSFSKIHILQVSDLPFPPIERSP